VTDSLLRLRTQLAEFTHAHLGRHWAVSDLQPTSGHAGFSYTFRVQHDGAESKRFFLRLPPAGVRQVGTADVLRQVCALEALDRTDAPHARVVWSGSDPAWFGTPYFITSFVDGVTFDSEDRVSSLRNDDVQSIASQALSALLELRRVPWNETCGYLLPVIDLPARIAGWDRFYDRAAERHTLLATAPQVRNRLLRTVPSGDDMALCHGDFQFGNLMFDSDLRLRAIIDWELCSVGPALRDLGWLVAWHDQEAWGPSPRPMAARLTAKDIVDLVPSDIDLAHLDWFEALALYEYAVISGFNLMLHRRGKRLDESWEWRSRSVPANLERARELLS